MVGKVIGKVLGVSAPKTPALPPPPDPVEVPDASGGEAQAKAVAKRAHRRRAGLAEREDTVLTTGLGLSAGSAATTRTALGG